MLTAIITNLTALPSVYSHSWPSVGWVLVVRWLPPKRPWKLDVFLLVTDSPLDSLLIQLGFGERKQKEDCVRDFYGSELEIKYLYVLARTQSYGQNRLQEKYNPTMFQELKRNSHWKKMQEINWGSSMAIREVHNQISIIQLIHRSFNLCQ